MAGQKVVVVEDEPDMLDIIQVNLEQAGYDVVPARDGVEAYSALESAVPDAVVLDLSLPNMSGFRLVRLIKRDPRWRNLPLIVVTAFAFEEVEDIANEGVDGFMSKPFEPTELVSRVGYVLSKSGEVAAS